jgi:hypothetical protein
MSTVPKPANMRPEAKARIEPTPMIPNMGPSWRRRASARVVFDETTMRVAAEHESAAIL